MLFFQGKGLRKEADAFCLCTDTAYGMFAKFGRQSNLFTDLGSKGTEHGVHIFIICMNYCLL